MNETKIGYACELAHALCNNKNVMPILLAGVEGFPDGLPKDIADVSRKNAPKHIIYYFDSFYNKLKEEFMESKPSASCFFVQAFEEEDSNILCQKTSFQKSLQTLHLSVKSTSHKKRILFIKT